VNVPTYSQNAFWCIYSAFPTGEIEGLREENRILREMLQKQKHPFSGIPRENAILLAKKFLQSLADNPTPLPTPEEDPGEIPPVPVKKDAGR
jgi:hypothetical protein